MASFVDQSLQARLAELGELVDAWTRDALRDRVRPPAERFGAILEYHLGWRDEHLGVPQQAAPAGKRLRSAAAALVSEAVCGSADVARNAAVAVELVHNFSLVHDDIQDRSELRRHRPTLWTLWGLEQGINAGDALFALAQLVILREPSERCAPMAVTLNEACLRLVEGQYLDITLQQGQQPPTLELYEAMIARKTGALFECACRLGAMAAGAPADVQELYATYGKQLGIAFQEQDDLLGVWGDPEETGKPRAADVVERKRGLPAVLSLGRPGAPAWLVELYASSNGATTTVDEAAVRRVIAHFDAAGVRAEAEARIAHRYQLARSALERAGGREPARSHLAGICDLLLVRRS